MTAPLFHVPTGTVDGLGAGDLVTVTGEEARHAAVVRRLRAGEAVIVADGDGGAVTGEVVAAAPDRLEVQVSGRRDEPEPRTRLVLVQALAKGGRDEEAVEAATELGVDEVVPWEAARSIVRWRGPKADKARQKWVNVVTAAAKQSRRARTPHVAEVVTTRQLVDRGSVPGTRVLVLHEDARPTLPEALGDLDDGVSELLLVVGPEGGIGEDETGPLQAAGATLVRLGPSVLRSSTAGPAALAVIGAAVRW